MKYSNEMLPDDEAEISNEGKETIPLTPEDVDKIKSALLALYYRKHHGEYNEDTESAEHTWNDAYWPEFKKLIEAEPALVDFYHEDPEHFLYLVNEKLYTHTIH